MTKSPQQEALDIYTSVLYALPSKLDENSSFDEFNETIKEEHETALKIAEMMVDRIIWEAIKYADHSQQYVSENVKYHNQVKEELHKMK